MPTEKKSEYWQRRAKEREAYWTKKSQETIERELARYYRESLKKIEGDITALYARFAEQTELSLKDAKSLLRGKEFQEWRMDLKAYVAEIKALESVGKTADAKALLRELDTLAMRSRVSRLDALHAETVKELLSLGGKIDAKTAAFLREVYKDNYYKTLFEIGKMGELRTTPAKVDPKRLEAVLRERWSGKNYSENIWQDTRKLSGVLQKTILDGVQRGLSVDKMTANIAKEMGTIINPATRAERRTLRGNAERIVRTEMTYIQNQANLTGIKDAGFAFYRYVAAHDTRTCQRCGDKDGLTVAIDEADVGSNLPPLHPRCRCTVIADFGDGRSIGKRRVSRDASGKNIHIPADMQYNDWKAVYIDKTRTLDDWAATNKKKLVTTAASSGIMQMMNRRVADVSNTDNANVDQAMERKKANTGEFADLEVPMQKRAVEKICREYGVDISGLIIKIQRDEDSLKANIAGATDYYNIGRIDLFPCAFKDEEQILRTVIHEKAHVKQLRKYGREYAQKELMFMERVARRFEELFYKHIVRGRK